MSDCNDVEMNRRKLDYNNSIIGWFNRGDHILHNPSTGTYQLCGGFLEEKYDFSFELFVKFLDEKYFSEYFEVTHEIKPSSSLEETLSPMIDITYEELQLLHHISIKDFLNYRKIEIAKKPSYEEDSCSDMDNSEELLSERNTPKYREWRNMVLIRDGECQCCGHNKHLHVHHIFGFKKYPKLRYLEDNGITLCKWCHEKYHSIYGRKNPNPVTFGKYMQKYGVKS